MFVEAYDAKSILTPTGGFLAGARPGSGYTHTLNPAIGCPYGRGFCGQFCYARLGLAHTFARAGDWGDYLRVKRNAADLLRRELDRAARRAPARPDHVGRLAIFASSSTDPCAGPTRPVFAACLAVLAEYPIRRIVIQTRAPGVLRLRGPIEALGKRAVVSLTLETDSDEVWRAGPRGAPDISTRRRLAEALREWTTTLHIAISPCLKLRAPERFADWIAATGNRATVDTFLAGDGASGARTARLNLPRLYAARGWDWREQDEAQQLFDLLRRRMGPRAGFSAAGFVGLVADEAEGALHGAGNSPQRALRT